MFGALMATATRRPWPHARQQHGRPVALRTSSSRRLRPGPDHGQRPTESTRDWLLAADVGWRVRNGAFSCLEPLVHRQHPRVFLLGGRQVPDRCSHPPDRDEQRPQLHCQPAGQGCMQLDVVGSER
jgi:hypothetical protein